jgi:hypothetical protein
VCPHQPARAADRLHRARARPGAHLPLPFSGERPRWALERLAARPDADPGCAPGDLGRAGLDAISARRASGGYVRSSAQAGARATFTASMRAVGWAATRDPNRGKATMYLDGAAVATVDPLRDDCPAGAGGLRPLLALARHARRRRAGRRHGWAARVDLDAFVTLC